MLLFNYIGPPIGWNDLYAKVESFKLQIAITHILLSNEWLNHCRKLE